MADTIQGARADTDRTEIDPVGQGEGAAQTTAGREVTSPAVTVPSPPATHNGAASAGEGPSSRRRADPEPPDAPRAGPAIGQPVDGLTLWDAEGGGQTPAAVDTIRLDQNERLLIPFTLMMQRVVLHYVNFGAISGYALCNGAGCLLCKIGRQQEIRDLWPVYDILDKAVKTLPITQNLRPHALRPQLTPLLRRLGKGEGPLLISLRSDKYNKFLVATLPIPEGAEDGAVAIRSFLERVDAGQIDLASAYQMLPNEEWAMIDEVKTFMVAKGVTL